MNFIQTFKNYIFSINCNLINPNYRFSSVFYKRMIIDFLLRIFVFLPFALFLFVMIQNGYFKETSDIMLQSGQNLYGYLMVIFIYFPILIFISSSFLFSVVGSILKRTIFKSENEISILPKNYTQAFLNSWKNLYYITVETFIIIFIGKIVIEIVAVQSVDFSLLLVLKALLITIGTSGLLALICSLPWLKKQKSTQDLEYEQINQDTQIIEHT